MVVDWIYLDALRNLGNSTEGMESREGEGGELERDHGCLSIWFLGGVVRCKRWDLQKAMLQVMLPMQQLALARTGIPKRPRPARHRRHITRPDPLDTCIKTNT